MAAPVSFSRWLGLEGARMSDAYTVVLVNKWGQVLERDGSFYRTDAGHPHFEARFADLDAARAFCEGVVRELPHVECDVQHGGRIVLQHFDAEWRGAEEEQVRRLFAEQRRRDRVALGVLAGLAVLAAAGLVWWLR
jgi:hypothetical protein